MRATLHGCPRCERQLVIARMWYVWRLGRTYVSSSYSLCITCTLNYLHGGVVDVYDRVMVLRIESRS